LIYYLSYSGLLSYLSLLGPSEIGSPWSSFHTATGQVAFHGINLLGLLGLLGLLSLLGYRNECDLVTLCCGYLYISNGMVLALFSPLKKGIKIEVSTKIISPHAFSYNHRSF
jgi:hypothetical protein